MNCPLCQHANAPGSLFCNDCGARLGMECPRCAANPPGTSFCNHCGRRLNGGPEARKALLAGQRRRVAVLFADLSGSTALGERFDAEVVFEVMNACFAGLAAIVTRHEGTVLKYIGDAMMVLFGAPIAHGDDPERAVLAALEMQAWLTGFSQRLEAERDVPFRMRIGVNYGPVIAGGVGALGRMEYDVLGDTVNVAQRLEAAAEPGAIYVSDAVERLARGAVTFQPVGLVRVKGRGESVNVFRALERRDRSAGAPSFVRAAALVGRTSEVQMLQEAVGTCASGKSRFLALTGEPGIGKSALVEYTAHLAREQGAAVYLLSGAEREVHDPFGSLRHWLRELCAQAPVVSEAGLEDRLRALISHDETAEDYLPDLLQLLDTSAAAAAPAGLDPETRRRLQIQGVCAFVGALARKQPLLLALDDLQWMDPLTLETVHTLADRALGGELSQCFLLVAYRAGTPPDWLIEGGESYEPYVWPLRALDESGCLELMRQWVQPEDLPKSVVSGIIGRAGGHPHYLVELLRHLLETEALRLEEGRWQWTPADGRATLPDTLYGAVAARLDRLQTGQLAAVQHGAAVGQQFPVWLVRELEPGLAWEENLAALEGMQFLTEQSPPPDWEMRFKQAVVRDVAYESLLVGHRRVLHGRIAALLEEHVPLRDCAALLAWHYEFAELWEAAARCHYEAGRIAAELFSNEDALRHQESALAAVGHTGVTGSDGEFEARSALAAVAARLGQYERAATEYERCMEWSSASPEARADVCGQLARCRHEMGAVKIAGNLWRRALRCLTGTDTPQAGRIRAALLGEWGFAEYRTGNFGRALRLSAWSHRAALAAGAVLEQADAANLRGLVQQARGELDGAIAAYQETQELAERTGDIAALATVRNNLGTLLFACGQLDQAQSAYEAALATWDRIGDRGQSATVLTNLGNLALARGQYDAAAAEFQRAHQLFSNSNQPFGAAAAAAVLGEVFLEQNQLDAAIDSLTEALETAKSLDAPDLAAYAGIGLAETGFRLGHAGAAATFLDEAESMIDQYDLAALRGQVWRLRGKLAFAEGELDRAAELLNLALVHFEDLEMRQEAGRTLVVLAGLPGQVDYAGLMERAREIFRAVGAEGDLARLETNLAHGRS